MDDVRQPIKVLEILRYIQQEMMDLRHVRQRLVEGGVADVFTKTMLLARGVERLATDVGDPDELDALRSGEDVRPAPAEPADADLKDAMRQRSIPPRPRILGSPRAAVKHARGERGRPAGSRSPADRM